MESVRKYSYQNLIKKLIGNKVQFKSDCEFFPNFNVTGKVLSYYIKGNELLFKVKVMNKTIDIGTNMKNLRFTIIKG